MVVDRQQFRRRAYHVGPRSDLCRLYWQSGRSAHRGHERSRLNSVLCSGRNPVWSLPQI